MDEETSGGPDIPPLLPNTTETLTGPTGVPDGPAPDDPASDSSAPDDPDSTNEPEQQAEPG